MDASTVIGDLVNRFREHEQEYKSPRYNETTTRRELIDPMFHLLEWDVDNRSGRNEAYKDVIHEDSIRGTSGYEAPDYGFRIDGVRRFFVEAKKPSVSIRTDPRPAYQLRRYAWNAGLPVSILTDFEELAIYDCRQMPSTADDPRVGRIAIFNYTEYVDRWDEIYALCSRSSVAGGSLDRLVESAPGRRTLLTVDSVFLSEIERWRASLAADLHTCNPGLSPRELNRAVQMTIDRIIFLRMAEDRKTEPAETLKELVEAPGVYQRLLSVFRNADDRYNSGLFHFAPEPGRAEWHDTLTPSLQISDEVLRSILQSLYPPHSPYEFSAIPVEILGAVYEQFLGSIITIEDDNKVSVELKPEVRKLGGVYYTPKYVVDWMVENTLGRVLAERRISPRGTVDGVRILDPSCGSGTFLISAYEYLLRWYLERYSERNDALSKSRVYATGTGELRLTVSERKRILVAHIFGVDIDLQAVEVTKLGLLLKVLEGEHSGLVVRQMELIQERVLPDLGNNIVCGNALIASDYFPDVQLSLLGEDEQYRVNTLDWEDAFPDIFSGEGSGFDVVVGNPPYIFSREQISQDDRAYYYRTYSTARDKNNTYMLFMEKMIGLLAPSGIGSYIVPNSWLTIESADALRPLVTPILETIVDLNYTVFHRVSMEPCIFVVRKDTTAPSISVSRGDNPSALRQGSRTEVVRATITDGDGRISFSGSSERDAAIRSTSDRSTTVGAEFDVLTGMQAYEAGRGTPPQSK